MCSGFSIGHPLYVSKVSDSERGGERAGEERGGERARERGRNGRAVEEDGSGQRRSSKEIRTG
jgi:hypothetical protein